MFPFFPFSCFGSNATCTPDDNTAREYRRRKLWWLRQRRDSLETQLAALNAAIDTLERQIGEPNGEG